MNIVSWIRRLQDRFLAVVDSEVVRPFQAIVYAGILTAAVYMSIYGAPSVVDENLGHPMFLVWMALCFIGPLSAALGDSMVNSGEHTVLHTRFEGGGGRIYWGWYLQVFGDIAVTGLLTTYVVATFETSWARRGIFAAFVLTSLAACAALLVLRDLRKVRAIERT